MAVGILAIVAMSREPRAAPHHFSEPVTPNCTSDQWDYHKGAMPSYHIGLGGGGAWNMCPDWKRRRTFEMT
jgi:hypothetical protein